MAQKTVPPKPPALTIVMRRIDELVLNPRHARKHPQWKIKKLASSIKRFGNNLPIVVNASNMILAGHAQWAACKRLGHPEIPVIVLTHLSPEEEQAFAIAANRFAELGEWDYSILGQLLVDFSVAIPAFDPEIIGFEWGEMDRIIAANVTGDTRGKEDVLPDASTGSTVTRRGDLWICGGHRVFCEDARMEASYQVLMDSLQARGIFTDPPYNVAIEGNVSGLGKIKHEDFVMGAGELSPVEFGELLDFLALVTAHLVNGGLIYAFMNASGLHALLSAGERAKLKVKAICTWAKNRPGMGSFYRSQTEFWVCWKFGSASSRNNIALGKHGRNRTTLWEYPAMATERYRSEEGDLLALHSTVKPVAMIQDAILDSTARGDIVLDPFLGSGTTLIAAQRCGRRCFGIELDPKYVDVIVRRWQAFTGEQAIHAETGETFDATAAARRAA